MPPLNQADINRARRWRRDLPQASILVLAMLVATGANARNPTANILPRQGTTDLTMPTDGQGRLAATTLVGGAPLTGAVPYTSTGQAATISLKAPRTIIDWTTFEVGDGNTLNFQFGGAASDIVVNRLSIGAIRVDKGGTVNGLFHGAPGGNIWFLAGDGVFIDGTVTASGVLATNNVNLTDLNLLADNITSLKSELAYAASLLDFAGQVTASGAAIDGSGNIILTGAIDTGATGAVTLDSMASITQTSGAITAGVLSGMAVTEVSLTGPNQFDTLSTFFTGGALSINDAQTSGLTLSPTGAVTASDVFLTSAGPLTVGGYVEAPGTVSLQANGPITESKGGLYALNLTGRSVGGATLDGFNNITNLAGFENSGVGAVSVTTSGGLTVTAPVDAGAGNTLTLTTAAARCEGDCAPGSLTLAADVQAVGGTVDLESVGPILQTGGVITTATLTGASVGGASLTSANQIDGVTNFSNADFGSISLANGRALNLSGTIDNTLVAAQGGAGRDVSLNIANGGLTGDGVVMAERDVAIQTGASIALGSVTAGDDIVLRAPGAATIQGSLAAKIAAATTENADPTAAGDRLAAAAPMTLFGYSHPDLTNGANVDVAVGGDLVIGGAAFASADVRLQSQGGSAYVSDINAGRDVAIQANLNVGTSQEGFPNQTLTAGRDVAIIGRGGDVEFGSAYAGSNIVLRAPAGGLTVTGALSSGLAQRSDTSGAGGALAGTAPMTIFGTDAPALTGGDIDIVASRVAIQGGGSAGIASNADTSFPPLPSDVRIVALGGDAVAVSVGGPLRATRDIAVDATGGTTLDSARPATVTLSGTLAAGRDIAVRSLTGDLNVNSAGAADDVVLVASAGAVVVAGPVEARTTEMTIAGGLGQTLFNTTGGSLGGLYTLDRQSIFIQGVSYRNVAADREAVGSLTAGVAIGLAVADPLGLTLADNASGQGSLVKPASLVAPTVSIFEAGGPLTVETATVNTPITALNLYASDRVLVTGRLAPSVSGAVTLTIGSPSVAQWTPSLIEVVNDSTTDGPSGSIGYASALTSGANASPPLVFSNAALYAREGIVLGTTAFVQANLGVTNYDDLKTIDPNQPFPVVAANTSRTITLAANNVTLAAGNLIVQQDTAGLHTNDGSGSYITGALTLDGYLDATPAAIDLFGVFARPVTLGGGLVGGTAAAGSSQIRLTSLTDNDAYRSSYRFNACVIGRGGCGATGLSLGAQLNPVPGIFNIGGDYPGGAGGPLNPDDPRTFLQPLSGSARLYLAYSAPFPDLWLDGLVSADPGDIEDPTITGAPNEEFWRRHVDGP
jgi:hypothetical protein